MEVIRPSAALRNEYKDMSRMCHDDRCEVIITVNGRGDTVLLGYQQYTQMKSELELLRTLADAEYEVQHGDVGSMQETFDDIKKSLLERKKDVI